MRVSRRSNPTKSQYKSRCSKWFLVVQGGRRKPQRVPGRPRRPQEITVHEAPGDSRRLQEAPWAPEGIRMPHRIQEASGGPMGSRRPQEAPWAPGGLRRPIKGDT
eukprot:5649360-Pyramimonas_sp.AAC.1